MPSYDLPGKPDAGAIVVFSNVAAAGNANPKAPTARTLYTADNFSGLSSQAGARFGASVAVWGAAFDDLEPDGAQAPLAADAAVFAGADGAAEAVAALEALRAVVWAELVRRVEPLVMRWAQ